MEQIKYNGSEFKMMDHIIAEYIYGLCAAVIDDGVALSIDVTKGEKTVLYKVWTPKVGQLLGKKGKNINAIRCIADAIAGKHGVRIHIDVLEVSASQLAS